MAIQLATRYPTKTNAPDASYPNGSFRDVTISGDGTGTPYKADIMNDIAGWQQELMDKSGLAENNAIEVVGASQYFEAMRLTAGYPGLITAGAFTLLPPSTLGIRLLKLDGSGILRANYPDLDAASWVGVPYNPTSDGFYRADDAAGVTRNTSGVYLILPDMRGQFMRGRDTAGAVDPDGVTRDPHTIQDWALYDHAHVVEEPILGYEAEATVFQEGTGSSKNLAQFPTSPTASKVYGTDMYVGDLSTPLTIPTANSSEDEVRPTNMNFDFYVWY